MKIIEVIMKMLIRKTAGGKISLIPVTNDTELIGENELLLEEKHLLYICNTYNKQESLVVPLEEVVNYVCDVFKISLQELMYRNRKQRYVVARQCYYFTAWLMNAYSLAEIGKYINRDHSIVLYAVKQCLNAIDFKDEVLFKPLVEILTHFHMWDIEKNKLKTKKQLEDE